MTRLELPLFPIMLLLSVLGHGVVFYLWALWSAATFTLPELIPSQPGVASVKLVASNDARPEPKETPTDVPMKEAAVPPPVVEPTLALPKPAPAEQPLAEVKPKEMAQKHESVAAPPKVEKTEAPKTEMLAKIAETLAKASPASQEQDGTVDELPQKLAINPPPPYPAAAVAARQEGTVTLRVAISAEGHVATIALYSSSGVQSLDDAALATVRRWVFAPARRNGRAVPFEVLVPVEFSIRRLN